DQEHSLYYHREEYVRWDGRRYQTVLPKETKAELTCAVKEAFDELNLRQLAIWRAQAETGSKKRPPVAAKVTTSLVGDAEQALRGLSLLPQSVEAPAWLGGGGPFPAAEVLACTNGLLHLPSLVGGRPGYLAPPSPRFFSFNALDYDFRADAPEPK